MTDVTGKIKMPLPCGHERPIEKIVLEMASHGWVQCMASAEHGTFKAKIDVTFEDKPKLKAKK